MNKRMNTVLFILAATVFNLAVIVALMLLSLLIVGLLSRGRLSPNLLSVLVLVFFLGSIVGAFLLYSWLVRKIARRVDMDKYFLPLFRPKKR